jgi:hypothetical protein
MATARPEFGASVIALDSLMSCLILLIVVRYCRRWLDEDELQEGRIGVDVVRALARLLDVVAFSPKATTS